MFTFLTGGVIQAAPAFSSVIRHSNLKGIDSNRMASDSNRFENGRRRSGMRFQFKFFWTKKCREDVTQDRMCRCVTHSVCKNFSLCDFFFFFIYSFFLCVNLFTFFWRVWLFIQYCTFKFLLHCILTSVCSVFFHVCASLCLSLFLLSFFLLSVQHNFCQNNMEQWGEEEEGSNKNFQQKNLLRNGGSFTCNVKMPHLASFSNDRVHIR